MATTAGAEVAEVEEGIVALAVVLVLLAATGADVADVDVDVDVEVDGDAVPGFEGDPGRMPPLDVVVVVAVGAVVDDPLVLLDDEGCEYVPLDVEGCDVAVCDEGCDVVGVYDATGCDVVADGVPAELGSWPPSSCCWRGGRATGASATCPPTGPE